MNHAIHLNINEKREIMSHIQTDLLDKVGVHYYIKTKDAGIYFYFINT